MLSWTGQEWGYLIGFTAEGKVWSSGRLVVAPDRSAECTVCAHSLLLPSGIAELCTASGWDLCTQPYMSKWHWMKHKERGKKKKGVRLFYPDPIFISQELLVGFAGTKLVISPPEVFIYLLKVRTQDPSYSSLKESLCILGRKIFSHCLTKGGRGGWGDSCSSSW